MPVERYLSLTCCWRSLVLVRRRSPRNPPSSLGDIWVVGRGSCSLSLLILTALLVGGWQPKAAQAQPVNTEPALRSQTQNQPNQSNPSLRDILRRSRQTSVEAQAQTVPNQPLPDTTIPRPGRPPQQPPQTPPVLPPPEDLFQSPPPTTPTPPTPEAVPSDAGGTIKVERFEVVGSTVFSREELAEATKELTCPVVKKFTCQPKAITFAELLRASDAITKLYTDKGYITSGAFIPANQSFKARGSVVKIQVVEGTVENIEVRGLKRLNPNYVRSRLAVATGKPLNVKRLLEALQLLQLNPLIKNISAELAAGTRPGVSVIDVKVAEAKTFSAQVSLDNNRVPSIGSFQRQIQLNQANLLGQGDALSIAYANTDGSNDVDFSYIYPINPYNGTLEFRYNYTSSNVIEEPFDILDIEGTSHDFALTYRQPIVQTPTQEFALGLTANRRESDIGFLEALVGERLPFPSPGADDGKTRLSVLRFFQEWTQRSSREVLAARSQFSLGIDAFNATSNPEPPDGQFLSWRGQGQWVRLLAPDTLLLLRTDAQLADRKLVPLEQFGLGGQQTVRGYRQDLLLTDKAFFASAELRYPILRVPEMAGVLQLTPFVDFGTASNGSNRAESNPNTIASVGLGLLWQSNRINARFDWGIPLVDVDSRNNTLQEDGLYFSVVYTQPF